MIEFRAGCPKLAPHQFQNPLPQSHPKMIYYPVIILAVSLLPNSLKQAQAFQLPGRNADRGLAEPQIAPDIIQRAVAVGQIDIAQHLPDNSAQAEILGGPAGHLDQARPDFAGYSVLLCCHLLPEYCTLPRNFQVLQFCKTN